LIIIGVGFPWKFISYLLGHVVCLADDLLRSNHEQVLEVPMNETLDFLVALNGFDVLKGNEDERQGRQYDRQAKCQEETRTCVFPFQLHRGAENTSDSTGLCQAQVKIC